MRLVSNSVQDLYIRMRLVSNSAQEINSLLCPCLHDIINVSIAHTTMRRTHRCQEPWDEHPLWEFRYDFATTKPPTGPTVERSNEYVTYLAPPSGAGPIYFTHFHFINAYGKPSTVCQHIQPYLTGRLPARLSSAPSNISCLVTTGSPTLWGTLIGS